MIIQARSYRFPVFFYGSRAGRAESGSVFSTSLQRPSTQFIDLLEINNKYPVINNEAIENIKSSNNNNNRFVCAVVVVAVELVGWPKPPPSLPPPRLSLSLLFTTSPLLLASSSTLLLSPFHHFFFLPSLPLLNSFLLLSLLYP